MACYHHILWKVNRSRSSGKGVHWWLNGFKPGKKVSKNNLKLSGLITLKSVTMAKRFKKAFDIKSKRNGRMVSFSWI